MTTAPAHSPATPSTRSKKRGNPEKTIELVATRRKQIFEAAARVFAEKGYHNATVQDVADEAGLGKGTLYEYVTSKKELLLLVIEEGQTRVHELVIKAIASKTSPIQKLRAIIHTTLDVADEHKRIMRMIFNEAISLDASDRDRIIAGKGKVLMEVAAVIEQGIAEGILRPINPIASADIILHNCWLWMHSQELNDSLHNVSSYEKLLSDIYLKGIIRNISGDKE